MHALPVYSSFQKRMSKYRSFQKRMSKCSSCKLPANDHKFGPVGPYCEGPDLSKQVDVRKKSLLSHMKTVPEHLVMDEDVEKSSVDVVDGDDDVEQEIIATPKKGWQF